MNVDDDDDDDDDDEGVCCAYEQRVTVNQSVWWVMILHAVVTWVSVSAGTVSLDVAVTLVLTAILGSWRQTTMAPANVSYIHGITYRAVGLWTCFRVNDSFSLV